MDLIEKIADIDKRVSPRVKSPVKITGPFNAKLIDISDGGMSFFSEEPLLKKTYPVTLHFPSQPINIQIEILRVQPFEKGHLVGAKILNDDAVALAAVRKEMISRHFKSVIKGIRDKSIRRNVLSFAKNFRDYIFELARLRSELNKLDGKQIQKEIEELSNNIVMKGEDLKRKINNKLVLKRIQDEFRMLVSSWAFKSQIMKRGFDKPKGYPGDYHTLEIIYDYKTFSKKEDLGYYFDLYFLYNPYADAVRNRKDILRKTLNEILADRKDETKILNLASGSCREIREIFKAKNNGLLDKKVLFSCLDWDEDALAFSERELKGLPPNITFDFIKEDILSVAKNGVFFEKHGQYDLIYSIGLADYLPDRVIKKLIKNSFEGLKSGGTFLIAHKDKEISFSHLPPEWFCDWIFIPRNEPDVIHLIETAGITNYKISVFRDTTRQIFFIGVRKA